MAFNQLNDKAYHFSRSIVLTEIYSIYKKTWGRGGPISRRQQFIKSESKNYFISKWTANSIMKTTTQTMQKIKKNDINKRWGQGGNLEVEILFIKGKTIAVTNENYTTRKILKMHFKCQNCLIIFNNMCWLH